MLSFQTSTSIILLYVQIEELSTEVFSVIESMKECRVPFVLGVGTNEDKDKKRIFDIKPILGWSFQSIVLHISSCAATTPF